MTTKEAVKCAARNELKVWKVAVPVAVVLFLVEVLF